MKEPCSADLGCYLLDEQMKRDWSVTGELEQPLELQIICAVCHRRFGSAEFQRLQNLPGISRIREHG